MLVASIFSVLVVLILAGLPIAIAMGLTALGFFIGLGETQMLGAMAQRMYSSSTSRSRQATPTASRPCRAIAISRSRF